MNKIANYLVKKAAKDNLDPEQTAFSWRHLFGLAGLAEPLQYVIQKNMHLKK